MRRKKGVFQVLIASIEGEFDLIPSRGLIFVLFFAKLIWKVPSTSPSLGLSRGLVWFEADFFLDSLSRDESKRGIDSEYYTKAPFARRFVQSDLEEALLPKTRAFLFQVPLARAGPPVHLFKFLRGCRGTEKRETKIHHLGGGKERK